MEKKTNNIKTSISNLMKSIEINKEQNSEQSIVDCLEVFSLVKKQDDKFKLIEVGSTLAEIYMNIAEYDNSLKYFLITLDISKELKDNESDSANIYNKIGRVYRLKGEWDYAMENFSKALMIYEKSNDRINIASCMVNIGLIYKSKGYLSKAIKTIEDFTYLKNLKVKLIYQLFIII